MIARSGSRRFAVLAASLAFVACACGSSGSDASSSTTAAKTSTTVAAKTTTTERTSSHGAKPTTRDLDAILPTAASLGKGWIVDTSTSDPSDEGDKAIEFQCPSAAALVNPDTEADVAKAKFVDTNGSEIAVTLSPSAEPLSSAEVTQLVSAINECEDVNVTSDDGTVTTFSFQAAADDQYGDQGVHIQAAVTVTAPEQSPIALTYYGLKFRKGTVGVSINAIDGIDADGTVVPADTDLLVSLASSLDAQVKDLVG